MQQRTRAGRYIRVTGGYRAFHPAPLPPDPPFQFDRDLQRLLSQADRAIGRLDGTITMLPNPDLFVMMYVRSHRKAILTVEQAPCIVQVCDILSAYRETIPRGPYVCALKTVPRWIYNPDHRRW